MFNERQPGRAAEFLAPGVRWHAGTGGTVEGRDNVIALIRAVVRALDGLTATEQDIDAAGDTVAVRYRIEAVHSGELLGVPATGRRIRWEPTSVYHIAQGKIVHAMTFDNLAEILRDAAGAPRPAPHSAPTA